MQLRRTFSNSKSNTLFSLFLFSPYMKIRHINFLDHEFRKYYQPVQYQVNISGFLFYLSSMEYIFTITTSWNRFCVSFAMSTHLKCDHDLKKLYINLYTVQSTSFAISTIYLQCIVVVAIIFWGYFTMSNHLN